MLSIGSITVFKAQLAMMKNLSDKSPGSFGSRLSKKLLRCSLFDDFTLIHKNDPIRQLPGKTHLLGDTDHGHATAGQLHQNVKDFFDHLRIQCGRRGHA